MNKKGEIHINGRIEFVNFLNNASEDYEDIISHFKGKIGSAGFLTDYFVMNDELILNWNEEYTNFKCSSHEEAGKLLIHVCKREHLLLMYMYLAEFMRYHKLQDNEFEFIKNLIWDELDKIK